MQLVRYIVRPQSPWGTPMRSDTLAGLLLWRMAERHGPGACRAVIDAFRAGEPPFILSSALPLGTVSFPRLPPVPRRVFRQWCDTEEFRDSAGRPVALLEALQKYKDLRKQSYLPLDLWTVNAARLSLRPLLALFCAQPEKKGSGRAEQCWQAHVSVNRRAGQASEGGLFFSRVTCFAQDAAFHLYAKASDPDELLDMLREAGDIGFGKDASTGKGRFSVEPDQGFDPATLENDGPHLMLCSVCAAMDMSALDGFYTVEAKRGKAGPGLANPHKAPMLLVQEGSVLRRLPKGPFILEGINADPALVQLTWPLGLPCRLVEEDFHD